MQGPRRSWRSAGRSRTRSLVAAGAWIALLACAPGACSRLRSSDASADGAAPSAAPLAAKDRPQARATSSAAASARPADFDPKDYVEVTVAAVGPTPEGNVVLLLAPDKKSAVPVYIGDSEAFVISLRLSKSSYRRPLTHDLLDAMLRELEGKIEHVRVERIDDRAFIATVVLVRGARRAELDARTSDAVALALGHGAPILMRRDVLSAAALKIEQLPRVPPPEGKLPPPPTEEKGVEM